MWFQDLKDYGRLGGNTIIYADVDKRNPGHGWVISFFYTSHADFFSVIEYRNMEEAQEAIRRLAGVDINGAPVTIEIVGQTMT